MRATAFVIALLFSASAFASTVESLVGTWDLVGRKCLDTRMEAQSSSGEILFIPIPEEMTIRFTETRFVADAKVFGCVFRIASPFMLAEGSIHYSSSSMIDMCTGLRLPVKPEPLHTVIEGDQLTVRGLFVNAGVCPLGRTPEYYLERRK
jgi:hypothetical protein